MHTAGQVHEGPCYIQDSTCRLLGRHRDDRSLDFWPLSPFYWANILDLAKSLSTWLNSNSWSNAQFNLEKLNNARVKQLNWSFHKLPWSFLNKIIAYCEFKPVLWINRDVMGIFLIFNAHKKLFGSTPPVGNLIEKYSDTMIHMMTSNCPGSG